jgi:hypothetical protein
MAGRDSWTSPVNALLDGVESTGGADTDAPETEYGSPWAQALREIMERHTGVSANDLRYVAPYQPSQPPFGQPPITNPQWPHTFDAEFSPRQIILSSLLSPSGLAQAATPTQSASAYASKFPPSFPSEMPDTDVTATPLMADGSGQFAPGQSPTTPAPIPVADQHTERRWPGAGAPPSVWDAWYDHSIKGIRGLIHSFRSNSGASTPRGGDDEDCNDRWQREHERCREFIGKLRDPRYLDACYERANYRHRLCVGNGGKPNPNEPDEYGLQDIPNDPAGR